MPQLLETIIAVQQVILSLWWLWLFILLVFLSYSLWMAYVQEHYKRSVKWIMFELRIPRELRKSPRAMEQIFMSLHGMRNSPGQWRDQYWDGETSRWFSCEVVSFGGEIHFYLRAPVGHRNMIQAAFYAHYPDLEIVEVSEDYIHRFPAKVEEVEALGYTLFGNELILAKPDAYPIRTFYDFEAVEEEQQLDPVATLLETLNKISPAENIWVQILIRPTDDSWKKDAERVVNELKEKVKTEYTTASGKVTFTERTPGEMDVMKAIQRNIGKPGFDTVIRYIYICKKEVFTLNFARRGVFSAFNQYASESLNKFKHNVKAWTTSSMWDPPYVFPKQRTRDRKDRIYANFRRRWMHEDGFTGKLLQMKFADWGFTGQRHEANYVLNVEELATIYHPPTNIVLTGPLIKRVEAKKIGPPAGLPIYGEGEGENLPGLNNSQK